MTWEAWWILFLGALGLLTWKYSGKKYFEMVGSAFGMQSARPAQIAFLGASLVFIVLGLLALTGIIEFRR
jgi:hypothetical protein